MQSTFHCVNRCAFLSLPGFFALKPRVLIACITFFPLIVFSAVCDSKADRLQNKRHFFSTLLYVSVLHLVILHFLFLVLFIAVSNNLRCKQ